MNNNYKKASEIGKAKKKWEQKKWRKIIWKHENSIRVSDLALHHGLAKSSTCTILKKKEAIKEA